MNAFRSVKTAFVPTALVAIVALAAYRQMEAGQKSGDSSEVTHAAMAVTPARVDSVLPLEEALRRFRVDIPDRPTALHAGFDSREALVRGFVDALERGDTLRLEKMVLNRAEFAYLYYPTSPLAAPPYELSPSLMWFQLQENNRKAASALLQKRSGMRLDYVGHECARSERQGENTIWSQCRILRKSRNAGLLRERLFGSIIERDGRYEILGLSNELQ